MATTGYVYSIIAFQVGLPDAENVSCQPQLFAWSQWYLSRTYSKAALATNSRTGDAEPGTQSQKKFGCVYHSLLC